MTPTALVVLFPRRYVDPEAAPSDLHSWSKEFTWRQDDWNGIKDLTNPVSKTVETKRGDCDDYMLVAASWALREGRDPSIGLCWDLPWPAPKHVVCVDETNVYSNGHIYENTSLADYIEDTRYTHGIRRHV